ncbi:MAG TPA: sugar phosphate isomerase/epimerase [Thermoleophilaceae bacterium]|jgi:inosose dehydratase|nr:sugar phosphate isomerase/epimerase [Thermoleophilaceae bacterium]
MQVRIANAPASWGIEDPEDGANPPWQDVLDQVAAAGYAGVELGPLGYLPTDATALRPELARRELELVAGFLFSPLHTREGVARALESARRVCGLLADAGGRYLVIIQGFTAEREAAAGRPDAAAALAEPEWRTMIEGVHAVARVASEDHGLTACFHPHAGTAVEFDFEIEQLILDTDPELVSLCIDTGHCAYAGLDPVALYAEHSARVAYLHLKDVSRARLGAALASGLGFEEAVAHGVFCRLGEGVVDFAALRAALDEGGFAGWATVEQDTLPTDSAAPGDDAAASLAHLRQVGLAA